MNYENLWTRLKATIGTSLEMMGNTEIAGAYKLILIIMLNMETEMEEEESK